MIWIGVLLMVIGVPTAELPPQQPGAVLLQVGSAQAVHIRRVDIRVESGAVDVTYTLHNRANQSVATPVTVHMPEYRYDLAADGYRKVTGLEVWVGKTRVRPGEVSVAVVRAGNGARDVTSDVVGAGLSVAGLGGFGESIEVMPDGAWRPIHEKSAIGRLSPATRSELESKGILAVEDGDAPNWAVRSAHEWLQRLPPGGDVLVRLRYEPLILAADEELALPPVCQKNGHELVGIVHSLTGAGDASAEVGEVNVDASATGHRGARVCLIGTTVQSGRRTFAAQKVSGPASVVVLWPRDSRG